MGGYWAGKDSDEAPKSAEGWHKYEVTGVLRGSKNRDFESRDGDPQLLAILRDEQGDEATVMFTLSDKAAWVLARFLSRAGVDLEELDSQGVGLAEWKDQKFAESWLKGLMVWGHCEHQQGDNGKTYTRVTPYHEGEVPASALSSARGGATHDGVTFDDGTPVPDDSDVPF